MKELLDKLSSYNLFNYLLPGTIFVAVAERLTRHSFAQQNIVVDFFVYYFVGLIVSRLGSLIIAPVFRRLSFIRLAPYGEFIAACNKDGKIELLSEQNNMYRTLCALFLALPVFLTIDGLIRRFSVSHDSVVLISLGMLFVLFAFAYRKQTQFVKKRVETAMK